MFICNEYVKDFRLKLNFLRDFDKAYIFYI